MSRNQKILAVALVLGVVALTAVGAWALFTFTSRSSDSIALNSNNTTSDAARLTLTAQVGTPGLATTTTPGTSVAPATSGPGVSTALPATASAPAASATNSTAPVATTAPSASATNTTATDTPVPPTATNTAVPPTSTPTSTPTNTAVPPSSTPTNTPTNTPVPFAVTNVSASVNPPSSNSCPTTFNFSAPITTNGAGSVTYKWERSDGASAPDQNLVFGGAGTQMVNTTWSIGAAGTHWERVSIISPNALTSNQATFTLTCFAGMWYHNFGTMNLAQSGNSVSGTYVNSFQSQSGTLVGTMTGNTFNGTYNINGGSGAIQWTFASSGQTFDGNWNNGTGKWCGARTGQNFPAGCGYAGSWTANVGGNAGSLNLTQSGTGVTGTYFNGFSSGTLENGAITYTSDRVVLTGNWRLSPSNSGAVKFYLFLYNALQFNGNFDTSSPWCGWRGGASQPSPCLR